MKAAHPAGDGQPFSPKAGSRARSDGFLEFFSGAERDLLAGLDLDWLAGRGIAAHACRALAHLQDAESADADAVALLEMLDDEIDHVAEDRLGLLLGKLVGLGDIGREVLQRHG